MERKIHFNQLPEELREQLVRNLNKSGPCSSLFEDLLSETMTKWFIVIWGGAGLMALTILVLHDYGELFGGLQSPVWILAYVFVAWFLWYGVLKFLRSSILHKNLPFKPGIYLFPLDLIDARDAVLRITPTNAVSRVEIEHVEDDGVYYHSTLKLIMDDGSVESMKVYGRALASSVSTSFETQRAEAQRALAIHDTQALARLDPLLSIRQAHSWDNYSAEPVKVSHGPRAKDLLTPFYYLWAFALILSIGSAPVLWAARHYLSDGARLEQAKATPITGTFDRAQAMEIYLDGGFRHRQEVIDDLLPKARLDVAMSKKTATALRAFLSTAPPAQYEAQADAALHQMYSQALTKFKAQANKANPQTIEFVTKLLAYIEREGSPSIDVAFVLIPAATLKAIDQEMAKNYGANADPKLVALDPQRAKEVAVLEPIFNHERVSMLERAVASRLQRFFLMIAPKDIITISDELRFSHDELKLDAQGNRTSVGMRFPRPTIFIDYEVSPGGELFTHMDDDGVESLKMSLRFEFRVWLHLPELEQPLHWAIALDGDDDAAAANSSFSIERFDRTTTYERTISDAFYRFTNKLLTFFFDPSSAVGRRLESSEPPFK